MLIDNYRYDVYVNHRNCISDIDDILNNQNIYTALNIIEQIELRLGSFRRNQLALNNTYIKEREEFELNGKKTLRIEKEVAEKEQLIKELDNTDISTLNQSQKDTLEVNRIKAKDELDKLKYLMEEVEYEN